MAEEPVYPIEDVDAPNLFSQKEETRRFVRNRSMNGEDTGFTGLGEFSNIDAEESEDEKKKRRDEEFRLITSLVTHEYAEWVAAVDIYNENLQSHARLENYFSSKLNAVTITYRDEYGHSSPMPVFSDDSGNEYVYDPATDTRIYISSISGDDPRWGSIIRTNLDFSNKIILKETPYLRETVAAYNLTTHKLTTDYKIAADRQGKILPGTRDVPAGIADENTTVTEIERKIGKNIYRFLLRGDEQKGFYYIDQNGEKTDISKETMQRILNPGDRIRSWEELLGKNPDLKKIYEENLNNFRRATKDNASLRVTEWKGDTSITKTFNDNGAGDKTPENTIVQVDGKPAVVNGFKFVVTVDGSQP
ncbi:MAG: hypothetical protein ACT4OY_02875 [Alphaproteobacteria bacterium]